MSLFVSFTLHLKLVVPCLVRKRCVETMNPLPWCAARSQGFFCFLEHCMVLLVELREGALSASALAGVPDHTHMHTHTTLWQQAECLADGGRPECQRAAMAATATDPSLSAEGDSIIMTTGYIIHLRWALAGSVHKMGKIYEHSIMFYSVMFLIPYDKMLWNIWKVDDVQMKKWKNCSEHLSNCMASCSKSLNVGYLSNHIATCLKSLRIPEQPHCNVLKTI